MRKRKSLSLAGALFFLLIVASGCNKRPVLSCAVEPGTIREGSTATFNTNATDPNKKDVLAFTYDAPDGGKVTPQNGSAVFDSTGLSPGTYKLSAEVRDKKFMVPCEVEVAVEKNTQPPTIACQPSSPSVTEGGSITLQAQASDPNNDPLTFAWTVDGQSVTNDQDSFNFGSAGKSLGSHAVKVTVTDVDNMSADCTFNVTIDRRPNNNPSVTLSLSKNEVYTGETVTATAQGSDPDNDPLTYSWTVDGQSRPGSAATLQINTSGMSGGSHSVAVTVRDDRGATATDTRSFAAREKIIIQMSGFRLDNVAKAQLDEIALKMQQNNQLRALLTGHTDDRGSEQGNERAGTRRAEATRDYLVEEHNIDTARIEVQSAGESQPIADNQTAEGRKENRRVEVELF